MASEEIPIPSSQSETTPLSSTPPNRSSSTTPCTVIENHNNPDDINTYRCENCVLEPSRPLPNTHPIIIDHLGCHDFDFSQRKKYKGNRLIKRIRGFKPPASSTNMSSEIRRASSDSEIGLIQRFSSMLSMPTFPSSPKSTPPPLCEKEKPLPTDRILLQNRLNFHIARLDKIKLRVKAKNAEIRVTHADWAEMKSHAEYFNDPELHLFAELHADDLEALRASRDNLRAVVDIHRAQLARLCAVRVKRSVDAGLGPQVPQIFQDLWTDEQWEEVFSV